MPSRRSSRSRTGASSSAKLVGTDPGTDIAVLQIPAQNLTALKFGDADQLQVGDYVIAIGNPFGIGQTVTSGIVSALGRSGLTPEGYEDFIQTDASINPGNSGGALVNLRGELVGINSAIIGPSGGNVGIGFAVPSNMARAVMNQIVRYGEVRRGRLGIEMTDLTPELAKKLGVTSLDGAAVTVVQPGSPAEKAGLRQGDVVTAMNGRSIHSSGDLRNRLGLTPVGEQVELRVQRGGATRSLRTRIAPPQEMAGGAGTGRAAVARHDGGGDRARQPALPAPAGRRAGGIGGGIRQPRVPGRLPARRHHLRRQPPARSDRG